MSSNVKVSGIPSHVKIGKLVPLFSDILSMRSSDFLMRILTSKGPVNDVLLSFPSYSDAQSAQEKLDNFVYKHSNITYVFTAQMDGGYNQYLKKPKAKQRSKNQNRQSHGYQHEEKYHRDRSHSPHLKHTSSQLDMHLEILRKQRLILEEERKLLEEQRKLDELRRRSLNNETMFVKTTPDEDIKSCELSSNSSKKKSERPPNYNQASEVLINKFRWIINKHSSFEERPVLLKSIRSIVKQRLAMVVAADGRNIYQTQKVIILYRLQYPVEDDEEFVKQALKNVKEGLSTTSGLVQASDKGAKAKNKPESGAGDLLLQKGKTTAKDATLSGDTDNSKNVKDKPIEKFEGKRLFFFKSSGALIRKMTICVNECCPPEKRKILLEYLRFTLKQRLAAVVGDQPIYQTYKIINLYREKHPPEDDKDLINRLLKDIDEGRMPEDVLNSGKPKKVELASSEQKADNVVNNTLQNEIVTIAKATIETGEPESNEDVVVSGNVENEGNIEKNIDDKNIQLVMEHQSKAENTTELNIGIDSEVENDEKGNMKNKPRNPLTDKTEEDATKPNTYEDFSVHDNIKTDVVATEASQKCFDNVKVYDDTHGVKRKADDDENNRIKIAKTNNFASNLEDTNKNQLSD